MSKPTPLAEKELVDRLRPRFEGESGNGPAGCLIPQVRDAAGFDAKRTIDALGIHYWPSRGLMIDAFECKSSRADWQRELADPAKADRFCSLADRFWIVAGRADLVLEDELPPDWGLLVPRGDTLTQVRPAVVLHADSPAIDEWVASAGERGRPRGARPLPPGFDRSFLIAIIRQAYRVTSATPEAIDHAYARGCAEGEARQKSSRRDWEAMYWELQNDVREFEQALGYPIKGHSWPTKLTPRQVGAVLRAILHGEQETKGLRNRLSAIARDAGRLAVDAQERLAAVDAMETIKGQMELTDAPQS